MKSKNYELAQECKRQSENCLYTSTALYLWLRALRTIRVTHISVSLLLGSFASWSLVTDTETHWIRVLGAVSAFVAGLLPAVFAALKFDDAIENNSGLASEFKALQDRFRQAAMIWSKKSFEDFERDFRLLMDRMDAARAKSVTPPELCFKRAQTKIKAGDYDFDIDLPTDV